MWFQHILIPSVCTSHTKNAHTRWICPEMYSVSFISGIAEICLSEIFLPILILLSDVSYNVASGIRNHIRSACVTPKMRRVASHFSDYPIFTRRFRVFGHTVEGWLHHSVEIFVKPVQSAP